MSRELNIPFFPNPPREYDQSYMMQLVQAFALFAQQSRVPGPGRNSTLVLTNLPTAATGLEPGTVWNDAGTLRIAP